MVGKQLLLYDEALLDPRGEQPFHLLPLGLFVVAEGGRGEVFVPLAHKGGNSVN